MTEAPGKSATLHIHRPVFWTSAGLIAFFVVFSLLNLAQLQAFFTAAQSTITTSAGWLFVAAINIYLGLVVYLLLGRYGDIRLGGPDARPEFSTGSWLAMLFSAGMGIGLVFWSVAEPIYHFSAPPWGAAQTA